MTDFVTLRLSKEQVMLIREAIELAIESWQKQAPTDELANLYKQIHNAECRESMSKLNDDMFGLD